jgi:16S rRNA (cytidine1402-2'-O)-methyltransferase
VSRGPGTGMGRDARTGSGGVGTAGEGTEPGTEPGAEPAPARGRLYVVATPIGNLGDVSFRALEVLRAVPLVAAEDTRITRRLFARYEITTHLVPHHARNAEATLPALLAHLRAGRDLALVTDAGTPLVSDPGAGLVAAWAAEGGAVVPVPGASAVLAALVASGVAGPRWSFEGFLPRRGRERRERLERLDADGRTAVLFEAPGRLAATLAELAATCGPERPAAVCRELTKLHEETLRGSLAALAAAAAGGEIDPRGEVVIVLGERPADRRHLPDPGRAGQPGTAERVPRTGLETPWTLGDPLAEARAAVARLVSDGIARGEAARRVAAATGLPRRRLYDAPDAGTA